MKPAAAARQVERSRDSGVRILVGLLGLLLGVALIKFGNPAVLGRKITVPENLWGFIYQIWPLEWGYGLVAVIGLPLLFLGRWRGAAPGWLILLPLIWLGAQFVSAVQTVDWGLTRVTLLHFCSCAIFFYVGLLFAPAMRKSPFFWGGLLVGFGVVIWVGWHQHFGGLEETRRYFYQLPNWREYPPEFLAKLASNRVYSTLFYPNTLAGIVILLSPVACVAMTRCERLSVASRVSLAAVLALGSLGCLFWSGSKSGWLIMLVLLLLAFWRTGFSRRWKVGVMAIVIVAGVAGFCWRYAGYFQRGATSLGARFEYWQVGWEIIRSEPILGTGPGTFAVVYGRMKPSGAEMARLAHNDYLEQWSDAGVISFLAYTTLIMATLMIRYRYRNSNWLFFAVWLAALGGAVQEVVEFGLYIPAFAWLFFLFLGALWNDAFAAPAGIESTKAARIPKVAP